MSNNNKQIYPPKKVAIICFCVFAVNAVLMFYAMDVFWKFIVIASLNAGISYFIYISYKNIFDKYFKK
jgi:hypothetical protein